MFILASKNLTPSGVFLTFQWHTQRQNFLPCFIFMSHPSQQIFVPEKKKFSYKDHLLSIISLKRAHTILSFVSAVYCCNLCRYSTSLHILRTDLLLICNLFIFSQTHQTSSWEKPQRPFFIKEIDGITVLLLNTILG